MWRGREKEASRYLPHHFLLWPRFSYSCSCIFFTKYDPPKKTNKQTNKVLQATSHVCRLRSGCEPRFFWQGRSDLDLVAHNCHGNTKNLTAKTKTSRRNQKPHGKNKIRHGKTKNFTAKPNTSQQKQNSFGFAVGICFCREVFGFCCEVFVFAVRSLVLPWGFWFCREVFCFCREVFGFAVRFSVLRWGILFLPWGFWFCRDSCVGHRSERLDYHFDLRARRQLSHLSLFGWWLQ